MHAEALDWVKAHAVPGPVSVLDIGGRDINGTTRTLFPEAGWTVLDIAAGPNVDVVADASTWTPDRLYDVVVCTEVFEHTAVWPAIIRTAYAALKPGGRLILTMAAPGREPHSAVDGGALRFGEYYANVKPERLRDELLGAGFTDGVIDQERRTCDVRAVATKSGEVQ
jgi:cyclopropane fatty-acyl-phospholipid synthase-like methyltransferase